MPKRTDIETILVLGSGPIVIGQAGEFDYSGTQACKALREEGYRVVLVNSNPATIMTDPETADRTYVEPLDVPSATAIIEIERPDALLPTLGGQTGLNLAMRLSEEGVLDRFGVELIGADTEAIRRAEDRQVFRDCMTEAGISVPESETVESVTAGVAAAERIGLPVILRPAFTLGGEGGGVARERSELEERLAAALDASPISQVLIERSVIGWGEYELEVMRDGNDNAVVVCSIENIDPMGVHTGDSVTVAPAMTLTDDELQKMRDAALAVIRTVGVSTGGANVQFALERESGDLVVIEMNPRVSRSSALASKATGFPIAKIAARLAVGYTLDELPNDITQVTPASFEPTLDYVAIKIPRFAFEKVPGASTELTTHMKSVGEVLAIGRTFREAFGKAMSARELDADPAAPPTKADALSLLRVPSWDRYDVMRRAIDLGADPSELAAASGVDTWFCEEIGAWARTIGGLPDTLGEIDANALRDARRAGLTDRDIAMATGASDAEVGELRRSEGIAPTFHAVDTCAAEFEARTPYFYAAFDSAGEVERDEREAIVVLGSGPNRIGQGIEFDYCCVHAVEAARDLGYAAIMVNCNPETVSTDHGVSDRLYMEPVTLDTVLDVCAQEMPLGVVTQLGGQTPLRLAHELEAAGVRVLGTPAESIDLAEDRGRFGAMLDDLGLSAPPWAVAERPVDALAAANDVGYPVLVRPSYVLGGRAMQICEDERQLETYLEKERPQGTLLVDRFLEGALEVDVDALSDGSETWVAATMEHVEAAGVHSGDSACVLPPQGAGPGLIDELERQTREIAAALEAVGLLNVQFAVRDGQVYVIEANPRASRTVPFVAKATGVPLVRHALRLMLGVPLGRLPLPGPRRLGHVAVKEAVLPFARFPGADPVLGPEMKATGEVMGLAGSFAEAFAKAQRGAGQGLPREGAVFLSARDADKPEMVAVAARLAAAGLELVATDGTARAIAAAGLDVTPVRKISEGSPHVGELIARGEIQLVLNTPSGRGTQTDGAEIRAGAVRAGIPCITTLEAAVAAADAIRADARPGSPPIALQDIAAVADSEARAPTHHP